MTNLAIVIPVKDEFALTRQCVRSIEVATELDYQIILVSNGSVDRTNSWFESYPRLRLVVRDHGMGYPAACNLGVETAEEMGIAMSVVMNNDIMVYRQCFERMLDTFNKDPKIGVVVPIMLTPDWIKHTYYAGFKESDWIEGNVPVRDYSIPMASGSCFMVETSKYLDLGGFDEGYGLGYFEDDDLSLTYRREGYSLVVSAGARIFHIVAQTVGKMGQKRLEQIDKNRVRFEQKFAVKHQPNGLFESRVPIPDDHWLWGKDCWKGE